ncbi:unnamed protein product [Caenorhabditis angaria]|uniref:SSD domain-containing protein n=1 Tax=Caenorhabditis angaria TaxID=860376 RepID=A0A9P1IWG9_9PELO|nr:unnamed protein product [Caenorhabditis angaria]
MRLPTSKFQKYMQRFFYRLGLSIGNHPKLYIVSLLVFTIFACSGFLRFHQINNARVTFTAHDSPSHLESAMFSKFLKQNGSLHMIEVIVSANDNGNLLRGAWRNQLKNLTNEIINDVKTNESELYFGDLCEPYCEKNDALYAVLDIFDDRNTSEPDSFELKYPSSILLGHQVFLGNSLYGVTIEASTGKIISFNTVLLRYYLTHRELAPMVDFENQLMDLIYNTSKYPLLNAQLGSDVQVAKEVKKLGTSSAPYLGLSLIFLIFFLSICSLRYYWSESKPIEACLGAFIPVLSGLTTIGLVSATGLAFQSIVVSTLFLVLAIGIDDVFIILAAWHRTDRSLTIPVRIARTVEEAGCSMTVTTVTNLISFGNGVFSTTPILQTFAIYSSAASVICFIYQLIIFPAIIAITAPKEYNNSKNERTIKIIKKGSEFGDKVWIWLAEKIEKSWMKLFVILILCIYWFIAAEGIISMKTDLSIQKMGDKNSLIVKFKDTLDAISREMQSVAILVNSPGDLRNASNMEQIQKMVEEFERATYSYGSDSTVCWISQYLKFLEFYEEESSEFSYQSFGAFLKVEPQFKPMIRYNLEKCEKNDPKCIESFIFTTGFTSVAKYHEMFPLLQEWRRIASNYPQFQIYPYTERSNFADQTNDMVSNIWQTVLSEVVCMAISFILFVPDISSIFSAVFSLLSVNLGVFGFLSIWGVGMDPISLAALLMSIGFSVDITAHISYHYYQVEEKSSRKKLEHVYQNIGWPTMQGGISTMLAMLPIIISPSYLGMRQQSQNAVVSSNPQLSFSDAFEKDVSFGQDIQRY